MNAGNVVLQEAERPAVSIGGRQVRHGSRRFYVGFSTACLAVAIVGFMPTYWLQLAPGTFDGPPLVHLHAWLFSAWPLYFLVQTLLAARGQVARHRAWGLLGVSLATAMVIVGIAVANNVLVTRLEDGYGDRARAFHIVSMSMMALFALFVAAALVCASRPEMHKRLMILATITILPPAVARLFFAVSVGIGPGLRPSGGPPRTVESVLDASLLLLPTVGFLPSSDPRIRGTIGAVERRLFVDGFLLRYDTHSSDDGLPGGEGAFLAFSFWLADAYVLMGRIDDARRLFERLLDLRNDVGLLAEEYDTDACRLVGNFPQAFSHVALINTAHNLSRATKPAEQRSAS